MKEQLFYFVEESDAPYNENESPYQRTIEDDLLLVKLANKNGDTFKRNSTLGKLQEAQHLFIKK